MFHSASEDEKGTMSQGTQLKEQENVRKQTLPELPEGVWSHCQLDTGTQNPFQTSGLQNR